MPRSSILRVTTGGMTQVRAGDGIVRRRLVGHDACGHGTGCRMGDGRAVEPQNMHAEQTHDEKEQPGQQPEHPRAGWRTVLHERRHRRPV